MPHSPETATQALSPLAHRDARKVDLRAIRHQRLVKPLSAESAGRMWIVLRPWFLGYGRVWAQGRWPGSGLTSGSADAGRAVRGFGLPAGPRFLWHPPAVPA